MKSQTPSTKLQTNLKFQYQMTKTGLEFGILVPPLADYLFDICDLEFLVTLADFRMKERRQKPPLGAAQSRVFRARILYSMAAFPSVLSTSSSLSNSPFSSSLL
jgi:hypothetical protein